VAEVRFYYFEHKAILDCLNIFPESPSDPSSHKLAKIDPSLHISQTLKPNIRCPSPSVCPNNASDKCSRGFCKACCERKDKEENTECEFHVGKERKKAEARKDKRARKNQRKVDKQVTKGVSSLVAPLIPDQKFEIAISTPLAT
jgi:hypothetical protein